jgi:hypothetical protein
MRFFIWFSAAMVWAITTIGIAAWMLVQINPDRPDLSAGDMVATIGILSGAAVLMIGGFVLAATMINRG